MLEEVLRSEKISGTPGKSRRRPLCRVRITTQYPRRDLSRTLMSACRAMSGERGLQGAGSSYTTCWKYGGLSGDDMCMKRWITGGISFCSLIVLLTAAGHPAYAVGWRLRHHESPRSLGSSTAANSGSRTGGRSIPFPKPSTIALIGSGLAAAKAYAAVRRRNRK